MISLRHSGFTLLELCLALAIAVLIIAIAVPSIVGLFAEQRLHESFKRFDRLAALARQESVTGERECRLVWDRQGVILLRAPQGDRIEGDDESPAERLTLGKGESLRVQRVAALQKNPPDEWIFWSNGTCEPVQIAYQGPSGKWLVRYDGLTAHGTFISSEVPR